MDEKILGVELNRALDGPTLEAAAHEAQ